MSRSDECRELTYASLPATSVIIVFHNEAWAKSGFIQGMGGGRSSEKVREKQRLLLTCAPIYELPSNINTMGENSLISKLVSKATPNLN